MKMQPLLANDVSIAGPYTWIDSKGVSHVGQVTKSIRGRLSGAFIDSDGNVRAAVFEGAGAAEGTFFGPLVLPTAFSPAQRARMFLAERNPKSPFSPEDLRTLAAKAAGAFPDTASQVPGAYCIARELGRGTPTICGWSPDDDGDMLRLAMHLGISIHFEGFGEDEAVWADDAMLWTNGDRPLATREVILRAVANREVLAQGATDNAPPVSLV